jgi:hypothetical protein
LGKEKSMRVKLMQSAIWLCVSATICPVQANTVIQGQPETQRSEQERQDRYEAKKAKEIAAVEVGGEATAARRIDLNGATGGWEVYVKVQNQNYGWKVIIDRDTWTVREKRKVDNQ